MELCNIKQIDEEHERLLGMFSMLIANEPIYNDTKYQQEIDQLLIVFKAHCVSEENIMRQYKYFDYADHVKTHNDLIFLVETALKAEAAAGNREQTVNVIYLLEKWVLDHIRIEVFLFKKLLKSQPFIKD